MDYKRETKRIPLAGRGRLIVLATILLRSLAMAQEPAPIVPPPEKDPFVGVWRENPVKSKPKPRDRDATYVRTITRDGQDLVFDSSRGKSKPHVNHYRIRCDGTFHKVPFGLLSCKYITSNLVEGETRPKSGEVGYWTREVSADGQEMKISEYKDPQKSTITALYILDRVK